MNAQAERIRALREQAGLTQQGLAELAGVSQPKLSAYERGIVSPKPETMRRIERAARLRPSVVLERHADEVLKLAREHHIEQVRVFGSSVHGTDTADSDIDLLVTFDDRASLFDASAFEIAASQLLGYPVDVVSDAGRASEVMERIRAEAVPL